MTIKPKKKSTQAKNEEPPEPLHHHGGTNSIPPLALGPMPNHSANHSAEPLGHEHLNTIQCWPHTNPCDKHAPNYDESSTSQSKRRRTSPASPKASGSSTVVEEPENSKGGYNSGDEHKPAECETDDEWLEQDRMFEKLMGRRGYIIKAMGKDGACLFRAVADQVYGDQDMHSVVRHHCMDYIEANQDYFSHYLTEDVKTYIARKRQDFTHGNHIEIQAMSEMYNRTVEVYSYGEEPINIFHSSRTQNDNEPIRLSYQYGSHYNSIVDPFKATVGVGLGLPNYSPGSADRSLVKEAVHQSENFEIEQAMLEDKLRATDWEATSEAIEEQVARESYLQWLRDNEKRNKASERNSDTSSSSATLTSAEVRTSPRTRSGGLSPTPSQGDFHLN